MNYQEQNFRLVNVLSDKSEIETARVAVADKDACSWVVTLSAWRYSVRGIGAQPPNTAKSEPFAIVEWGMGQVAHQARVDWPGSGLSFTLHSAFVRVTLQNVPTGNLPAPVPNAQNFRAGAHIVPGTNRERAPLLTLRDEVSVVAGAGNTASVIVPPFARGVRWFNRNSGQAGLPHEFFILANSDVTAATSYMIQRFNSSPELLINANVNAGWSNNGYMPIPQGAGRLIFQTATANAMLLDLQWIIDLG